MHYKISYSEAVSGCPVELQKHIREGVEDIRDRLLCSVKSDVSLKVSRQFQSSSQPSATSTSNFRNFASQITGIQGDIISDYKH